MFFAALSFNLNGKEMQICGYACDEPVLAPKKESIWMEDDTKQRRNILIFQSRESQISPDTTVNRPVYLTAWARLLCSYKLKQMWIIMKWNTFGKAGNAEGDPLTNAESNVRLHFSLLTASFVTVQTVYVGIRLALHRQEPSLSLRH